MKILINFFYTPVLIFFLFSCNNGTADSVKTAKKENTEMIDSMITTERPVDSIAAIPSKKDADFLVNAASGGMLEVQLGKLAQINSQDQRVKSFGAMMIKDHAESGKKLKALAASKNVSLPDSISNQQQKEKDRLRKKKGNAFDKAYIDMMVIDHKKDIREFEQEAAKGMNKVVKAFARDNLRMLHTHLDSAANIQRMINSKTPSTPIVPVPDSY